MTPNLDPFKVLRDAGEASGGVGVAYVAVEALENVSHLPPLVTDFADTSLTIVLVFGAAWSCTAIGKAVWHSFKADPIARPREVKMQTYDELNATKENLQKQIKRVQDALAKHPGHEKT